MNDIASPEVDEEIDLTDPAFLEALMRERHARRFDEAHIVEWLRTSGGPLADRIMKHLAADAIERSWSNPGSGDREGAAPAAAGAPPAR